MALPPSTTAVDAKRSRPRLRRWLWIWHATLMAACVVVFDDSDLRQAASTLVALALLGVTALALVALLYAAVAWNRTWLVWGGSTLCLLVGAVVLNRMGREFQISLTQTRGDAIAEALLRFHGRSNAYPDQLRALVPDFLPRIPSTALGLWTPTEFHYARLPEGNAFELGFWAGSSFLLERGPDPGWHEVHGGR